MPSGVFLMGERRGGRSGTTRGRSQATRRRAGRQGAPALWRRRPVRVCGLTARAGAGPVPGRVLELLQGLVRAVASLALMYGFWVLFMTLEP